MFGFADMSSFVIALDQSSNDADKEYAVTTTNCTATFTLANTSGWGNRSGFIRVRGFYYDPVYVSVPDVQGASGNSKYVPVTNPVSGTNTIFAELIDENYQSIAVSTPISLTFASGTIGVPPEKMSGGGGHCQVAIELWGYNDDRTHQARFYVISNNNWFTRLYKKYGTTWAKIVKRSEIIKSMIKPIWKYMSAQGKEFYNNPTGHPRTTRPIRDLHKKYPGQFKYYLIGSNARNERVTH